MKRGQDSSPEGAGNTWLGILYILHLFPRAHFHLRPSSVLYVADTLLCHFCLQLTSLPVSLSHTELSKWSSVSSCCPVSHWSAWPWFHFPQEWAHWKQSACGFQRPSSGWLQQNATLSNKDYMLPTVPPIHTLALLDSLQRFQPKNLSQKLCSLSNHYQEVQFLWQLRRWVIPAVPGTLSSSLT